MSVIALFHQYLIGRITLWESHQQGWNVWLANCYFAHNSLGFPAC